MTISQHKQKLKYFAAAKEILLRKISVMAELLLVENESSLDVVCSQYFRENNASYRWNR